ncbi:MAG: deoxyhypusine synthase family protein [Desulfomonile tiedjei]|nr:deoxyhypusine synthase family protein [Desulfomonile tiedjei]
MTSDRFPAFDRSRLRVLPLAERRHDLNLQVILPLEPRSAIHDTLRTVAERMSRARDRGAAVVLMIGGHVIRSGVQRYLIDLMESGYISCVATNGSVVIHDFELALIGSTTESVSCYIKDGRFGLWNETSRINDIVTRAAAEKIGLGEAVGRAIEEERLPHRGISILAAGYRLGIPVTVHVGIGYDIVHEMPNCDGASYGAASYEDFLRFAHVLESLEGGVLMNLGSAVMAPEVYLKALAMVRNVAAQEGRRIADFTTLVCDLVELPPNYRTEASREEALYYFRPWKTMLVRTVADGGESWYLRLPHHESVPQLWTALKATEAGPEEPAP